MRMTGACTAWVSNPATLDEQLGACVAFTIHAAASLAAQPLPEAAATILSHILEQSSSFLTSNPYWRCSDSVMTMWCSVWQYGGSVVVVVWWQCGDEHGGSVETSMVAVR